MPSYLTAAQYRARTTIPNAIVDECMAGGTRGKDLQIWLNEDSSWLRARLVKRYAVDFGEVGDAPPDVLLAWLVTIVDGKVWKCTGTNPEGRVDGWYDEDRKTVAAEVKEAADSKDGLFELPVRNSDPLGASGVNRGGPLGYSEASPYTWVDRQREAVSNE